MEYVILLCNFLRIPWYITRAALVYIITIMCMSVYTPTPASDLHFTVTVHLLYYHHHHHPLWTTARVSFFSRLSLCVRTSDIVSKGNNRTPLHRKSCAVLAWNGCTWPYTNNLPSESSMTTELWMGHGDILQVPLESGVSRRDVLLGCVSLCPCLASAFM